MALQRLISRGGAFMREQPQHDLIHALVGEDQRAFVDPLYVARGHHGFHVHVAEQSDFFFHLLGR